jgi:ribonuclease HI
VLADFIVGHGIKEDDANIVAVCPWKVFFDGSVCAKGCGVGYLIVSPRGIVQEMSERLEFKCTNNCAAYEALLAALEYVVSIGVKDVEVFGDSKLVVQQVKGENQCLDVMLNQYRDNCVQLVDNLDTFHIQHIHQEDNQAANRLAQQASGYNVKRGRFSVKGRPTSQDIMNIEGEGMPASGENVTKDWRVPLRECIMEPGTSRGRKIHRQALKYTVIGNEPYRRTMDGLLLKCLEEEQSKVVMGEVHEGMCGTHQSAHKM